MPELTHKQDLADEINKLTFIGFFSLTAQAQISAAMSFDIATNNTEYDQDTRNGLLRSVTGMISKLNVNVACYPVGYPTTILFDGDGNPV